MLMRLISILNIVFLDTTYQLLSSYIEIFVKFDGKTLLDYLIFALLISLIYSWLDGNLLLHATNINLGIFNSFQFM